MRQLNDFVDNSPTTDDGVATAAEVNQGFMREIQNIIPQTSQAFNPNDLNQLGKGMAHYAAVSTNYTDVGTPNNYILQPIGNLQSPASYFSDMIVRFRPANSNTGVATVNVNGLGPRAILLPSGPLNGGEMRTDENLILRYSQADDSFIIDNPTFSTIHATELSINEGADNFAGFFLRDTAGVIQGEYGFLFGGQVHQFKSGSVESFAVTPTRFGPQNDNIINCGAPFLRVKEYFGATGAINTSDRNEKRDIQPIPMEILDAFEKADPDDLFVIFRFIDSFNIKGDEARIHTGVIAQTIENILKSAGVDPFRYGLICLDEEPEQEEIEIDNVAKIQQTKKIIVTEIVEIVENGKVIKKPVEVEKTVPATRLVQNPDDKTKFIEEIIYEEKIIGKKKVLVDKKDQDGKTIMKKRYSIRPDQLSMLLLRVLWRKVFS